jgi:hypothetical protein
LLRAELGGQIDAIEIVSANAYLGAEPIAAALAPALRSWSAAASPIPPSRSDRSSRITAGAQATGIAWARDDGGAPPRVRRAGDRGYFADPGMKDVPDLADVGFPIAEIDAAGRCVVGKAENTGGLVSERTVKEQLLYEVHDPSAYVTPDVVADISQAEVRAAGNDRVALEGVRGHPRPERLKVTVCHEGGWIAEGEISYAGPGAEARARLAGDVLRRRLEGLAIRVDLIGTVSVFADDAGRLLAATPAGTARDVRVRVAARSRDRNEAERLAREVTALYCCGPAGGGGVRTALRPRLETLSCYVPRDAVEAGWEMVQ